MPFSFARRARFVKPDAVLNAAVPGIPKFVSILVILPAVVASAFSSSVVRLSKKWLIMRAKM